MVVVQTTKSASPPTKVVLDACYGPELGTKSFDSYEKYKTSSKPVGQLIKRVCFAREVRLPDSDPCSHNLYSLMQLAWGNNLLPPFDAAISVPDHRGFMATWTVRQSNLEAHISITRFESEIKLQREYNKRQENLQKPLKPEDYEQVNTNEGSELRLKKVPTYLMISFSEKDKNNYFLAIVEGTLPIETIMKSNGIRDTLCAVLENMPKVAQPPKFISSHRVTAVKPKDMVPLEAEIRYTIFPIRVTITPEQSVAKAWRGFDVTSQNNYLNLLSCWSDDNGIIYADFLPTQKTGEETLNFIVYGPDLDAQTNYVVTVKLDTLTKP